MKHLDENTPGPTVPIFRKPTDPVVYACMLFVAIELTLIAILVTVLF